MSTQELKTLKRLSAKYLKEQTAKSAPKAPKTAWVHRRRVISFRKGEKGKFTPVNKRAGKAIAPRKSVEAHELVQFQGYHKVQIVSAKGVYSDFKG